jgi:large repetitive protein
MTTIDPNDSADTNPGRKNYFDPTVEVWENVDFADNYYQTVSPNNPIGRRLDGADYNVLLNGRAGFVSNADGSNNAHERALAWYTGTMDLGFTKTEDGYGIQRRWGDFGLPELNVSNNPNARSWYQPVFSTLGSKTGLRQEEGLGTGWFYSVFGGGYDRRHELTAEKPAPRQWLGYDNTNKAARESKGDYAVPTLFNGNFDAIQYGDKPEQMLPGWLSGVTQSNLVRWDQILSAEELKKTPYDPNNNGQRNYALKLGGDGGVTTVGHNSFVVTDWGTLRFDLHAPKILGKDESGPAQEVRVTLTAEDGTINPITRGILLREAQGTRASYDSDRRKIGYGSAGFETFTIDIPDEFRGKVATLSFSLTGGESVYLDNVFFKSQHLSLGNPTLANNPDDASSYLNNYLFEKPQYASSYSGTRNIPNWVGWELDKTWLGSNDPGRDFFADPDLPKDPSDNLKWYGPDYDDYRGTNPDIWIPGTPYKLAPGHMAAFADRKRSRKDAVATNSTVNILPQHEKHNFPFWEELEGFSRDLVTEKNKELYVIAGGFANNTYKPSVKAVDNIHSFAVPEYFWKVIAVVDPGQDINVDTKLIATVSPNQLPPIKPDGTYEKWYDPNGMRIISVRQLENLLNADSINKEELKISYDFFNHVSQDVQDIIENRVFTWPGADPIDAFQMSGSANLLASLSSTELVIPDLTLRPNSIAENGRLHDLIHRTITSGSTGQISIGQISIGQISPGQDNTSQISSSQVGSSQVNIPQSGHIQSGLTQVSTPEDREVETRLLQGGLTQIGIGEIAILKAMSRQIGLTQVSNAEIATEQTSTVTIGFTKIDSLQISVDQLTTQTKSAEIPFSSTISQQQFLGSDSSAFHNFSLQNTTIPTWTEFLTGTTPFNLNIESTDLPTGQLAEANITRFDPTGRPTSGTLTLDIDGNGLGWF